MAQINTEFLSSVNNLAAIAYGLNIDCPPLRNLVKWTTEQHVTGALGTPGRARITTTTAPMTTPASQAGSTAATFDDAVLAAVTSSTNGVPIAELGDILRQYGKTNAQIGAALARQAKLKKIEKKGNLWFAAVTNGNVDRSMQGRIAGARTKAAQPARRRGRPAKAAAAGAPAA